MTTTLDELKELAELCKLAELCVRSDAKALVEFPSAVLGYLQKQHEMLKQDVEGRRLYRQKWEEVNKMVETILAAEESKE